MNGDDARARFDAAIDEELTGDERAAFEAALAGDAQLRAEFDKHREVVLATRRLGSALPAVDLLPAVQEKLRARSGGKFYRDRFAVERGRGKIGWMLGASALFLLVAALWLAYDAGLL